MRFLKPLLLFTENEKNKEEWCLKVRKGNFFKISNP